MMRLRRKIAILGATGSIGSQALDIARRYPERFEVVCLTARASAEKLFELVRTFRPRVAALGWRGLQQRRGRAHQAHPLQARPGRRAGAD